MSHKTIALGMSRADIPVLPEAIIEKTITPPPSIKEEEEEEEDNDDPVSSLSPEIVSVVDKLLSNPKPPPSPPHTTSLRFLDDPEISPSDPIYLQRKALILERFAREYPELEEYIKQNKIDEEPGNLGIIFREILLFPGEDSEKIFSYLPITGTVSTKVSPLETFLNCENDMFFVSFQSGDLTSTKRTEDACADAVEQSKAFASFVESLDFQKLATERPYFSEWDRLRLRIKELRLTEVLENRLASGNMIMDKINMELLNAQERKKLLVMASYRRPFHNVNNLDKRDKTSSSDFLLHLQKDMDTLVNIYPAYTYYIICECDRRDTNASTTYSALLNISSHFGPRISPLLRQTDSVFWLAVVQDMILQNRSFRVHMYWKYPELCAHLSVLDPAHFHIKESETYVLADLLPVLSKRLGFSIQKEEEEDDDDHLTTITECYQPARISSIFRQWLET